MHNIIYSASKKKIRKNPNYYLYIIHPYNEKICKLNIKNENNKIQPLKTESKFYIFIITNLKIMRLKNCV